MGCMRRAIGVGRRLDVLSRQLLICPPAATSSSSTLLVTSSPTSSTLAQRQFTSRPPVRMASDGDKHGATAAALKVEPKDTIFAKIVDGTIPKKPIGGIGDVKQDEEALVGHLMFVATQVAREQGLGDDGYRLVINEGTNGQQSVRWFHIHLLGGRKLTWPPG